MSDQVDFVYDIKGCIINLIIGDYENPRENKVGGVKNWLIITGPYMKCALQYFIQVSTENVYHQIRMHKNFGNMQHWI